MNKHFPSNILEAVVIFFLPLTTIVPMIGVNALIIKLPNQILFITIKVICFSLSLGMYFFFNRRKSSNTKFNFHLGKGILNLSLILLAYLFALAMPLNFLINVVKLPSKLGMFSIIILTPIFEETIFRGIILKGLLFNYSPKKSIIISTILFASIHIGLTSILGAAMNVFWSLLLGLFLGYVFYKTKSLGMAIILHMVNNILVVLGIYLNNFFGTSHIRKVSDFYGEYSIYIIITNLILFFFMISRLYRKKLSLF